MFLSCADLCTESQDCAFAPNASTTEVSRVSNARDCISIACIASRNAVGRLPEGGTLPGMNWRSAGEDSPVIFRRVLDHYFVIWPDVRPVHVRYWLARFNPAAGEPEHGGKATKSGSITVRDMSTSPCGRLRSEAALA